MTDKDSNKKILIIFSVFTFTFLFFNPVKGAALNIDLNVRDEFSPGETVSFNYTISSDEEKTITYRAEVECQMPIPSPTQKTVNVGPKNSVEGELMGSQVTEDTENQVCNAQVRVLSPGKIEKEREFNIKTKPGFNFRLKVCRDSGCTNETKIIYKDRKAYLDYSSGVSNASVKANLVSPGNQEKKISLPTSRKLSKIGTYTLEATASKEGYKTTQDSIQFAVINESADIKSEKPEIPGLFARVCRSELCENELNKVEKGREIWLDYSSDLDSVSLTAKLIYPDGTSQEVELREEKKLSQTGKYELRITGSKKGYKETKDSYSFKVEETVGERTDGKEKESWLVENSPYLIFGIGIVVLIIIFFSLFPRKN